MHDKFGHIWHADRCTRCGLPRVSSGALTGCRGQLEDTSEQEPIAWPMPTFETTPIDTTPAIESPGTEQAFPSAFEGGDTGGGGGGSDF